MTQVGGNKIEYDEIGNPIKIGSYNSSLSAWNYYYELTWEGRELQSYQYFEYFDEDMYYPGQLVEFTYNADGIRTSKTVDGARHEYILNGSQIIGEWFQTAGGSEYLMTFLYDEAGAPIGVRFGTGTSASSYKNYFFEKNLQGDIIAIYNAEGEKICTYAYDAWGNCTTTITSLASTLERNTVCQYNPFRYRGYYFDTETGLYYLQSRYYNPNWGRFISPDNWEVLAATPEGLTDKNLYAYCDNNPVMRGDADGEFWNVLVGAGIGAILGGIVGGITASINGQDVLTGVLTGAAVGAVAGAIVGSGNVAMISSGLSSVANKATTDTIGAVVYGTDFGGWEDYATAFVCGGISGALGSSAKQAMDIMVRPAVNQVVKQGTRGSTFDLNKYAYDVTTRWATRRGSNQVLGGKIGAFNIKIDIGKAFYRSTARGIYSYLG